MSSIDLNSTINDLFHQLVQGREKYSRSFTPREVGAVISVSEGIVRVSGLPGVGFEELLKFPGDIMGIAYNICLLYTSPSPRDRTRSRMPSSA